MTTIEPIDKLVNVLMQVSAADAVKGARQKAFQIGGDNVHHEQPLAGLLRRCDFDQVLAMATHDIQRCVGIAANGCATARRSCSRGAKPKYRPYRYSSGRWRQITWQRLLGVFKHRSDSQRGLMVATGELMKRMMAKNVNLTVAAARAIKAVRPAMAHERFEAGLLARKGAAH